MEYETRTIKVIVAPKGQPIYSDRATTIEIDDDAAGEFVKISQSKDCKEHSESICFDRDEWQVVKVAIDEMVANCRDYDNKDEEPQQEAKLLFEEIHDNNM